MVKNYGKKAAEVAVNTVVMIIIGLVIFGIGMGLFGRIAGSADSEIEDLNNKIRSDISNLQCDGDKWICVPSNSISNGAIKTFEVFIANQGDVEDDFTVEFNGLVDIDGTPGITKSTCGSLIFSTLPTGSNTIRIKSGNSGSLPFIVKATRVTKTPCSFVTTVDLKSSDSNFAEKASVIVRVE